MTKDFKDVRAHLESERRRLLSDLELKTGQDINVKREDSPFGNREETADRSSELEKRFALVQRIREQVAEVEHALKKLEKGTYGLCDCCGKPISPARLEALPQANLCLDCKAKQCESPAKMSYFRG